MKTLNDLVSKARREIMSVDESELENLGKLQKVVEKYMRETASATIEAVRPNEAIKRIIKTSDGKLISGRVVNEYTLEFDHCAKEWMGEEAGR